jgi:hypothetical protein
MRRYLGTTFRRILVVGCGSGLEAVELAEAFKSEVVGIDLDPSFDPLAAGKVELRIEEITHLYSFNSAKGDHGRLSSSNTVPRLILGSGIPFILYRVLRLTPLTRKLFPGDFSKEK